MGYLDGGADVRAFRAAVLSDLVKPVVSLLLTAALAEARVATDPAGNSEVGEEQRGAVAGRRPETTPRLLRSSRWLRAGGSGTRNRYGHGPAAQHVAG